MEQIDVKKLLKEFHQWVLLGGSILFVGSTILLGGESKIQTTQKNITKDLKTLRTEMDNDALKKEELPAYVEKLHKNWGNIAIPQKGPDQELFYEKAKISYKHAVPPTQQWINSCKEIQIRVDREKIHLAWDVPEPPVGSDGKAKEMTEISGYHLRKFWTNDANKPVEEIFALEETSYEDTKVEPKIDYQYQVRAYTNNKEAKGGKLVDFQDKKVVVSEFTAPKKGMILPLYRLRLTGVSEDTAFIELSKWEKGDWRTVNFHVRKKEKIEKNKVYIKELKKAINFNPGWTLLDVTTKLPQRKKIVHSNIKIDPVTKEPMKDMDGKIIKDMVEEEVTYYVAAIKYSDEKGKVEIKEQEVNKPEPATKQEVEKKPK